ncbi:hypothetical protein [Mesorhizobium sp. Root157]|uniref:hypothetical protein n=1 Tax=Mesorhizobium sp. Root157 TaxID=1736477 RepID=UPI000A93F4DD|nr:hypothetical protein [Mesorhizobium sp. Root157]
MSNQTKSALFFSASVVVAALVAIAAAVGVVEALLFAAFVASAAILASIVAVSLDVRYPEEYQPVRVSWREHRGRN